MTSFRVKSPVRVDLCGGTLDLWPVYCNLSSGRTINCAISLFASVDFEVENAPVFRCELKNLSGEHYQFTKPLTYAALATVPQGLCFPAFLISEYLKRHEDLPQQRWAITLSADFPLRSGLGGSSAMAVALARGIARIYSDFSEQGWQWNMMNWVRDIEAAYLRVPTGTQDYLASLFGGLNSFISSYGGIERVGFQEDVLSSLGERMVVLFSGEMHNSGISNWELFKRAFDGDKQIWEGFQTIAQLSDQLDGELRGHVNWKYVGQVLSEEWKIRRDIFKVQTSRLDEILDFLKNKKVLGAKVTGAAQGGSIVVLVDPAHREKLITECEAHKIQVLTAKPQNSPVTILPL